MHDENVEGRVRPFKYRYRISVSVTVTQSGTVRVLNSTRYLQYSIPTSMRRMSVLGWRYRVLKLIPDTDIHVSDVGFGV